MPTWWDVLSKKMDEPAVNYEMYMALFISHSCSHKTGTDDYGDSQIILSYCWCQMYCPQDWHWIVTSPWIYSKIIM